jgi:hypothetical protein
MGLLLEFFEEEVFFAHVVVILTVVLTVTGTETDGAF